MTSDDHYFNLDDAPDFCDHYESSDSEDEDIGWGESSQESSGQLSRIDAATKSKGIFSTNATLEYSLLNSGVSTSTGIPPLTTALIAIAA